MPVDVAERVREGARLYDEGRFWHAHEAWEEAWHALKAKGLAAETAFVHGLILATAAFENLQRGKREGFRTQIRKSLERLAAAQGAGADLGVSNEAVFVAGLVRARDTDGTSGPPRLETGAPAGQQGL